MFSASKHEDRLRSGLWLRCVQFVWRVVRVVLVGMAVMGPTPPPPPPPPPPPNREDEDDGDPE